MILVNLNKINLLDPNMQHRRITSKSQIPQTPANPEDQP